MRQDGAALGEARIGGVNLFDRLLRAAVVAIADLIDRIAAHPEDYDVAANRDPNARLEAETPDD